MAAIRVPRFWTVASHTVAAVRRHAGIRDGTQRQDQARSLPLQPELP